MIDPAAAELRIALAALISRQTLADAEISDLQALSGGASRETWRFMLSVSSGAWQGAHDLILRRQLGGKIYQAALDVGAEFEVIGEVYRAGVPCPRPLWHFPDVRGRPGMVVTRLAGESIGRRVVRDPSLEAARSTLPAALGATLAKIHQYPLKTSPLRTLLPAPAASSTPARVAIEQVEADLDRIGEPHPALELCLRWLRRHEPPPPARLVLVHGDFRIGNMLISPPGLEGVLDWEFAHVGEAAEDLAWGMVREWRFGVDSKRFGGVGQPSDFLDAYVNNGGESVDPLRITYWEIMGNARWAVGALNQAHRHLSGQEPNLEFASLGRRCAEMELEALRLIRAIGAVPGELSE